MQIQTAARWMAQKAKDADKVNAENETQTR